MEERGGVGLYSLVKNNPVSGVDALGLAGFFFDGTNNNRTRDTWNGGGDGVPTNIAVLSDLYVGLSQYYEGVGTGTENHKLGNLFGRGMGDRLGRAMVDMEVWHNQGKRVIDVFGFSRGAATARAFVNQVKKCYPDVHVRFWGYLIPSHRLEALIILT